METGDVMESTKHRTSSRTCAVNMSWLGDGSLGRCLLHKREDPRVHLKMASVELERGLICQECSSRGPEFGSQPPILGDSQTLIIPDSRHPMTSLSWTLQCTHSQAHTDT